MKRRAAVSIEILPLCKAHNLPLRRYSLKIFTGTLAGHTIDYDACPLCHPWRTL